MKNSFGIFLVFFTCLVCFLLNAVPLDAVNMQSPLYRIQFGNINIGADNLSSEGAKLSITMGQLAAEEFETNGYIIKAGFQYIHSIIPFTFSVSNTNINLGTLTPNMPSTDSTTLTVSFGGAGRYSVTAIEEHALQLQSGLYKIDDTVCDGGGNTCYEGLAKPWTSNNAYGFGYNMSGDDVPSDFVNATYFRPFADKSQGESPVVVMESDNVGKRRQATATFKVNVSPVQAAGTYQTVINFVATPSY